MTLPVRVKALQSHEARQVWLGRRVSGEGHVVIAMDTRARIIDPVAQYE
jgi:hypothetical protein